MLKKELITRTTGDKYNGYRNTITINVANIINNQRYINDKYPNPLRGGKFIDIFDNMSGQILEEVYENSMELYDPHNEDKDFNLAFLEELSDVLMYCGSLFIESCIAFNYPENELDYILQPIKFEEWDNYKYMGEYKISSNFIASLRRKIYDRKYHKPHKEPEDMEEYHKNFLKSIITNCYGSGFVDLNDNGQRIGNNKNPGDIIAHLNGWVDIPLLNEVMVNKQMKIISL